jgi:predicted neutral ceramidase superfamily lipid hydrolase
MLPAGGFIHLIYYCIFRWLSLESKRMGYPGSIYGWMLPLGQVSVFGFLAAIGTIDGDGYPIIHDIGAVFFFIILFLLSMIITLVVRDMHFWDPSAITRGSFLSKTLFAVYLIIMVIYCVIDALMELKN